MKLKKVMSVFQILACTSLLVFLFMPINEIVFFCIGFGILLASVIFTSIFWRCPHCKKHLGRLGKYEYCYHCGKRLDL